MPKSYKSPALLARMVRHGFRKKAVRRMVMRAFGNPLFPHTFFLRNLIILGKEPEWRSLSTRTRKHHVFRMIEERSRFFLEVKRWLTELEESPGHEAAFSSEREDLEGIPGYCTHCGGCCEIASGKADFPPGVEIPRDWRRVFGGGLGKYHRFCAFLWEEGTQISLCAIHPWRPIACRTFEREECDYLKQEPEHGELVNQQTLRNLYRWTCRLSRMRY